MPFKLNSSAPKTTFKKADQAPSSVTKIKV